MADNLSDDGSDFNRLLGKFGSHLNRDKRARAERLSMMKPGDARRKPGRPNQFSARVSDEAIARAQRLTQQLSARDGRKWSQPDLVEHALIVLDEQLAKSRRKNV